MKKTIFGIVIVLALIGILLYFKKAKPTDVPVATINEELQASASPLVSTTTVKSPPSLTAQEKSDKEAAWTALQNYLAAVKEKDVTKLATLSFQLSPSCKDYTKNDAAKKDCDARMESVANMGSRLIKGDYTTVWSDDRQIILSTPYSRADASATIAGYLHGIIYFVKTDGQIKLLSFNPARGILIPKTATSTETQIKKQLEDGTADTDKDGLEDHIEKCYRVDGPCTKTDPNKRDTDGDNYWDGVEALFYK